MRNKSVISEARDIGLAIELIELGARLQLLEAETNLSRERLLKLYKEVRGVSPPKGMLPFSTDWFMTWQPNMHASLFMAYSASSSAHPARPASNDHQGLPHVPGPDRRARHGKCAVADARLDHGALLRRRHAADDHAARPAVAISSPMPTIPSAITSAACATCRPAPARPAVPLPKPSPPRHA